MLDNASVHMYNTYTWSHTAQCTPVGTLTSIMCSSSSDIHISLPSFTAYPLAGRLKRWAQITWKINTHAHIRNIPTVIIAHASVQRYRQIANNAQQQQRRAFRAEFFRSAWSKMSHDCIRALDTFTTRIAVEDFSTVALILKWQRMTMFVTIFEGILGWWSIALSE